MPHDTNSQDVTCIAERRTDWLAMVEEERVMRVPHNVFPVAIDPEAVSTKDAAAFMRNSDWIVGVTIGGQARCYPGWIMDNYHVVNDTVGGVHLAVNHCEICCSNAIYLADHDGSRITFGTEGMYGATMSTYDIQTDSIWSHGMGTAITGAMKGTSLPLVQSFQASYAEWLHLHPQTDVMAWSAPEVHPDGRHGHGAFDTFAKPGMPPGITNTMTHGADERLPEHEMVVTFHLASDQAVIPLREIMRAGGVFEATIRGEDVVALSLGPTSSVVGTFHRHTEQDPDRTLHFAGGEGPITGRETGSKWTVDGRATAGPLEGQRLKAFPTTMHKWHSLACYIRDIPILTHGGTVHAVDAGTASPVVDALRQAGFAVDVRHRLYDLELPDGAHAGAQAVIDGGEFNILVFEDDSLAEDAALSRPRGVARGCILVESKPDERWSDALHTQPLSDSEIAWSDLPGEKTFQDALRKGSVTVPATKVHAGKSLSDLKRKLENAGYAVSHIEECPRDFIPVHCVYGAMLKINDDPFIVYRFDNKEDAEACEYVSQHSLVSGPLLLRSDPANRYAHPVTTMQRPDDEIDWSPLLDDADFKELLGA